MTILSPPPNWYVDPTGRHESRYWDGFTWTAHVADRGALGLDPLVRSVPVAAAPPDSAATPVGHGTARLQAMAAAPPEPAVAPDPVAVVPASGRAPRRRSLAYEISAGLAIVIVIVLGGVTLWRSWRSSDPGGRTDPTGSVPFRAAGYRVEIPPSWTVTTVPTALGADGAWAIIDTYRVLALVGREVIPPAVTGDDGALEQLVVDLVVDPFTADGTATTVVDRGVDRTGARRTGRAAVDATLPDGTTLRAVEYLVVTPRGSVAVGVIGLPDAVERHRTEVERVARSARIG